MTRAGPQKTTKRRSGVRAREIARVRIETSNSPSCGHLGAHCRTIPFSLYPTAAHRFFIFKKHRKEALEVRVAGFVAQSLHQQVHDQLRHQELRARPLVDPPALAHFRNRLNTNTRTRIAHIYRNQGIKPQEIEEHEPNKGSIVERFPLSLVCVYLGACVCTPFKSVWVARLGA